MVDESPVKGAPPTTSRRGRNSQLTKQELVELVDKAITYEGEWWSIPLPAEGSQGGYASTTAQMIGRRFADISTKGGRLWIRIK